MLRQRLLAAVIVRERRAVQSFGFKRWLPLGSVPCLVQNLDHWGADGIVVLSTDQGLAGPDLELIQSLSSLELSTPLTYGGGIRNAEQARQAVQAGAERLVLDRVLSETPEQVPAIAEALGAQALIASLPLIRSPQGQVMHWQHWCQCTQPIEALLSNPVWLNSVSELLVMDVNGEGHGQGPDQGLLSCLRDQTRLPVLAFGGLSTAKQLTDTLQQPGVAAAVVGNALNYSEQSIRTFKQQLTALPLRRHPIDNTNAFA